LRLCGFAALLISSFDLGDYGLLGRSAWVQSTVTDQVDPCSTATRKIQRKTSRTSPSGPAWQSNCSRTICRNPLAYRSSIEQPNPLRQVAGPASDVEHVLGALDGEKAKQSLGSALLDERRLSVAFGDLRELIVHGEIHGSSRRFAVERGAVTVAGACDG
jgi:hypothetical protein